MREGRNRQAENHHDRERRRRDHIEKKIKRDIRRLHIRRLRKLGWRVRDDQGDHDGQ